MHGYDVARHLTRRRTGVAGICAGAMVFSFAPARSADPIKIGPSLSLTGAAAPAGGACPDRGLEIWRDHVNARGGLLGRLIELVVYDDQANPANEPGIYAKLMGVDKVDLLIGPYSTNVIAAALPAIRQNKCDSLAGDEAALRKRYIDDPRVIKALDEAQDF